MESKCLVRLKREDCELTKHDSAFSNWKVLIGPKDWENYSLGKEGSEKYRFQNLPRIVSPGVYELGIAAPFSKSGHRVSKLDSSCIVPTYLGQADNVRARLQQYGRSGAHLSTDDSKDGVFKEAFSRGYSIVYRWVPIWSAVEETPLQQAITASDQLYVFLLGLRILAFAIILVSYWVGQSSYPLKLMDSMGNPDTAKQMNNKEAQTVEAQLLKAFDYAWNKGSNGARRPNDVFQRLNESTSGTYNFSKKLLSSHWKQLGIEISGRHSTLDIRGISYNGEDTNSFLPGIFKLSTSHPRLVSDGPAHRVAGLCGVALDDEGSICRRPPVKGRKRCEEHKGMRTNIRVPISSPCEKSGDRCKKIVVPYSPMKDPFVVANSPIRDGFSPQLVSDRPDCAHGFAELCGVALDDEGSICRRPPVKGRKRCEKHKGMRANIRVPISSPCEKSGDRCKKIVVPYSPMKDPFVVANSPIRDGFSPICGVILDDGSSCRKQPAIGRKRCTEHEGMRIRGRCVALSRKGAFPDNHGSITLYNYNSSKTSKLPEFKSHMLVGHGDVKKDYRNICGVDHGDGTFCTRQPARGRVRCEEHKGMRIK